MAFPASPKRAEVFFFPTAYVLKVEEGAEGKEKDLASAATSDSDLYEVGIPRRLWPLEEAIEIRMRRIVKNAAKA